MHNQLPRTSSLKQLFHTAAESWESRSNSAECSGSVSHEIAILWSLNMHCGFPSKTAYSHSCRNQFACWLLGESLGSFTWASLKGSLSVLKIWLSWLLEWVIQEDAQGGCSAFYDLVSEVTNGHFCYILLVGSQLLASPDSRGEELGSTYREAD